MITAGGGGAEALRPGDPTRVGRYQLTARLGEGGQGTVYLGTAPSGSPVAVKVLRSDLAGNGEARDRFVREVSVARRVAAFCTAQVIETGVDAHRPFIASEYIDGPTLAAVVERDGPRHGPALHRLAVGTVTALAAIHQAGVVHRDFKPSNVLLGQDGPRVIDFGIARALDRASTLTSVAVGTPAYMTPEQLSGEQAGTAADMFAWACTMVYAATGEPPFGSDSLPAVFNRIVNAEPDLGSIEEPLRGLVTQCLAKDPSARPTSGEILLRLLGHAPAASPGDAVRPLTGMPPGAALQEQVGLPGRSLPQDDGLLQEGTAAASPGTAVHAVSNGAADAVPTRPGRRAGHENAGDAASHSLGGRGARRLPHVLPVPVVVLAVVLALAGGGFLLVNTRDPAPAAPSDGRALPGTSIVLEEKADDPIKVTSYAVGDDVYLRDRDVRTTDTGGGDSRTGGSGGGDVRAGGSRAGDMAGGNGFAKAPGYFEVQVEDGGARAVGIDTGYASSGHAAVSVIDRVTGRPRTIETVKAPLYVSSPAWSPDHSKILLTALRPVAGDRPDGAGFVIVDVVAWTATFVKVTDPDVGEWSYFWRGDGRAVATWATTAAGEGIRFYALDGAALTTLTNVGTPIEIAGDIVSPSGGLLLTRCPKTSAQVCAWTADGAERARVPFPSERLIGWYDEDHIAGWRRAGDGCEIVVAALDGTVVRRLATASTDAYKEVALRYTRTAR